MLRAARLTAARPVVSRPAKVSAWWRRPETALGLARMCITSPSLRAREVEQAEWDTLLAPHLRARLSPWPAGSTAPDPRPSAMVAATLACLQAATVAWVATDGDSDLLELFEQALGAVRQ